MNKRGILRPNRSMQIEAIIQPIKAPMQSRDTNSEASETDNGPDFNGVSSDVNNIKLGPAEAHIRPWKK